MKNFTFNTNTNKDIKEIKENERRFVNENNVSNSNSNSKNVINEKYVKMKSDIKKLFLNYSQCSNDNSFQMNFSVCIKILKTLGITNHVKNFEYDILLKKINPKVTKLNESQFNDFLVLLAEKIFPDMYINSRKLAFESLYTNFILPYIEHLDNRKVTSEEFTQGLLVYKSVEDYLSEFIVEEFYFKIFLDITDTLYEIYKIYFHFENNNYSEIQRVINGSQASLIEFCKDYEITPYNVSYNQVVNYYRIVTDKILSKIGYDINKNHKEMSNISNDIFGKFKEKMVSVSLMSLEKKENNENLETFDENGNLQNEIDDNEENILKIIDEFSYDKLNSGKIFKFLNFLEMLIHFSDLSFLKLSYSKFSNMSKIERFVSFLEKLQGSKGFKNLERKTNRPHKLNTTLIPLKSTLQKIDPSTLEEHKFNSPETLIFKEKTKEIKNIHQNSNNNNFDLRNVMSIDDEMFKLLESKIPLLKDIFISYAAKSDKLSFMKLNYSSYLNFLKDSKIIKDLSKEIEKIRFDYEKDLKTCTSFSSPSKKSREKGYKKYINDVCNSSSGKLTETDVSIIFQVLTGPKNKTNNLTKDEKMNKENIEVKLKENKLHNIIIDRKTMINNVTCYNKLDFFLFLKSFEILAIKLYPNLELNDAFKQFLINDLKNILDNRKNISILYSEQMISAIKSLKDTKILTIVQSIHDVLLPLYQNYCKNNGNIDFESYFEFYKDFDIFPEIIGLVQLKNVFFVLSESFSNEQVENSKKAKSKSIDHNSEDMVNKENKLNTNNLSNIKEKIKEKNLKLNYDENNVSLSPHKSNKICIFKNEYINYPLFLQSLAFSALFFKYDDLSTSNVDKLLYLIERMSNSKGIKKANDKSGKTK